MSDNDGTRLKPAVKSGARGESGRIIRLAVGAALLAAALAAERMSGHGYLWLFVCGYLVLGGDVLRRAAGNIGRVFDENFLMAAATLGAFALGEYAEAVSVMLFYQVGESFQEAAVNKSRRSITRLLDTRPDSANLKKDGRLVKVAPETVQIGEVIVIRPGEKIPLDGVVIEGEARLDTSALTGEPVPRGVAVSDRVFSGCVNQDGVLTVKVTQTAGESTAARIISLVESAADRKAPTEHFITRFARYYTPAVVGLAVLIAVIPPLAAGGGWADWARRGLVFLVISCPCALVISIPLGFFGGLGRASRRGILIKGGHYLEALNHLDIVAFDKTGTLTRGVFKVTEVKPAEGFSEEGLLSAAASAEAFSSHPIALSIRRAYGEEVEKNSLTGYRETAGGGVSVNAGGRVIAAGNEKLMAGLGLSVEEAPGSGAKVYVAVDGVLAGRILVSDEVRPDSLKAIAALKALGVRKTVMLTGDNQRTAEAVAAELGLDEAFGDLWPWQKVEKVEALPKRPKGKLAFVGDGINDAPVLARADIGVAMGGLGSDAAIEAADVVLMTDEPSKLVEAVGIARFTRRVVWQNIFFALGVKALVLGLGALGVAGMWEAVFADVGVALLAVLNAARVPGLSPGPISGGR